MSPPGTQEKTPNRSQDPSAFAALHIPAFRALWTASLVSNIGTWMHQVGSAWLMTSLAPDPLMVSLIQTASSLPVLLFALPAGALADIVDRRRLLILAQIWLLSAATLLGVLTLVGIHSAWLLLGLTFALGLGTALMMPAWQAIVPELVARDRLQSAVSLSGASINVARALGPAIGGVLVSATGPASVFLLNAASFVGVLYVLWRWQRPPQPRPEPVETIYGAIKDGLRYVRHAPQLRNVLLRSGVFILSASALWAMLPLVAMSTLRMGGLGYGILLGSMGTGAVLGTGVLGLLRARLSSEAIVAGSTILLGGVMACLALVDSAAAAIAAVFLGGMAWLGQLSTLNVSVQLVVPGWIRARALAFYNVVFMGGTALGSTAWGLVGSSLGVSEALLHASISLVLSLAAAVWFRLPGDKLDLDPSLHWPEPIVAGGVPDLDLPAVITVEYRIDPGSRDAFVAQAQELRRIRLRDGAIVWRLEEQGPGSGVYVETFETESWAEHLRQHHRFTMADKEVEARVRAFHVPSEPPRVVHGMRRPHGRA